MTCRAWLRPDAALPAAVQKVDQLSSAIHRLGETDPARVPTLAELEGVVAGWTGQLQGLGLEVKGLWTSTTVTVTTARNIPR